MSEWINGWMDGWMDMQTILNKCEITNTVPYFQNDIRCYSGHYYPNW